MEKETYNVAKKILDQFGYAGSNKTGPAPNTEAAGQPTQQHQDKMRSSAANGTTAKSDSPRQNKPHVIRPSSNKSSPAADYDCRKIYKEMQDMHEMKRRTAAAAQLKQRIQNLFLILFY